MVMRFVVLLGWFCSGVLLGGALVVIWGLGAYHVSDFFFVSSAFLFSWLIAFGARRFVSRFIRVVWGP